MNTDEILSQIQKAFAEGTTRDEKEKAAAACRLLLRVLEAKPGEPIAPTAGEMAGPAIASSPTQTQATANSPASSETPVDTFGLALEALTAKLRSELDEELPEESSKPRSSLAIPFVQIPSAG
jgi:hypothetical protein